MEFPARFLRLSFREKGRACRRISIAKQLLASGRTRHLKDPVSKALKADFDAAHEDGKRALKERDFESIAKVVERERELIEQQRRASTSSVLRGPPSEK